MRFTGVKPWRGRRVYTESLMVMCGLRRKICLLLAVLLGAAVVRPVRAVAQAPAVRPGNNPVAARGFDELYNMEYAAALRDFGRLHAESTSFAAIIDDGVISWLAVEPGPGLTVSSAEEVLAAL